MNWLKYLKDKYQYTQTVIPTKEQIKMVATENYQYAKETIPKIKDQAINIHETHIKPIKMAATEHYEYAKETIPKLKDQAINLHETHIKPMTKSLHLTSNVIRISALMMGTGLLLFGLGYALNPIVKIFDAKNKKDK